MKKKGYVLIYVLMVLLVVSVVILYSLERLQFAASIEREKGERVIHYVKAREEFSKVYTPDLETLFHAIFNEYYKEPYDAKKLNRTFNLFNEDGNPINIATTRDAWKNEIRWKISSLGHVYSFLQSYSTPFDASVQEGGKTLDEKFDYILLKQSNIPYEFIELHGDYILKTQNSDWIIYTEALTEDTELEILPEELHDTEEDSNTKDIETNENPETEDSIAETPEVPENTETEIEAYELIEVERFSIRSSVIISLQGDLSIEGKTAQRLNGIILLNGTLQMKDTNFNGIFLHQGPVSEQFNSKITGFYEADYEENKEKLNFISDPSKVYVIGNYIPDFFSYSLQEIKE